MTPRKSLTPFSSIFLPKADASQTSDKKLAQLWLINSAGAGKAILKHELDPSYPMPALPFLPCCFLGASLLGMNGGVGWEGQGWVIGSWIFLDQDWSDLAQMHRKNQKH